jgi:hypothetical protein
MAVVGRFGVEVHAWARLRSDPHEFEAAVHDIADRIEATPQNHRLPPPPHRPSRLVHRPRKLDHHRRPPARPWPWAAPRPRRAGLRLDHGLVPDHRHRTYLRATPLRDQQPADIAEQWRQHAHVTFARVRDDTGHPRDAVLNQILTAYAQWLIRAIDATGTTPPGPWTGTHPQTSGGISTRDLDSRPHR